MRHACMIIVAGLLLGLAPTAAQAKRSDFIGTWRNDSSLTAEILKITVTSSYQVFVNDVTYAGILVTYGTTGAPDGHTTATVVIHSGATTTTLILGTGTIFHNGVDTSRMWGMKLVDKSNLNGDGNTHKYLTFHRYIPIIIKKSLAPAQEAIAP